MSDFLIQDGVLKRYCGRESHVEIPEGVHTIGYSAFEQWAPQSLVLPKSLTTVHSSALSRLYHVKKLYLSDLTAWLKMDFGTGLGKAQLSADEIYVNGELLTDLVLPEGISFVRDEAFSRCSSLRKVTVPPGVTAIGSGAFRQCSSLSEVILPQTLMQIDYAAFMGCSRLTEIALPQGLKKIGNKAFHGCSAMSQIYIPDSVAELGGSIFEDSGVSQIHISDLNAWMKIEFNDSFRNPLTDVGDLYLNAEPVRDLVIPETVDEIKKAVFRGCRSLKSVTVPSGVHTVGAYAFADCPNLESVDIPCSVQRIAFCAFQGCSSLSLSFPSSVQEVGPNAFEGVKSCGECPLEPAEKIDPAVYESLRPTLWTMCEESEGTVKIGEEESVFLSPRFYDRSDFDRILGESEDWYILSQYHETIWDFARHHYRSKEWYSEIPYSDIVVQDGHFAGLIKTSNEKEYNAAARDGDWRRYREPKWEIALVSRWDGTGLQCGFKGIYGRSQQCESWETTTFYLCKKT